MTNGGQTIHEQAIVAAISERVKSLDQDYQDLRKSFSSLEARGEAQHTAVLAKIDSLATGFSTKLEARLITPWPTIWGGMSVGVAILIALGTAFYMPIRWELERGLAQQELLRMRSYTQNGELAELKQAMKDQEARYNTISQRVIAIANSLGRIP